MTDCTAIYKPGDEVHACTVDIKYHDTLVTGDGLKRVHRDAAGLLWADDAPGARPPRDPEPTYRVEAGPFRTWRVVSVEGVVVADFMHDAHPDPYEAAEAEAQRLRGEAPLTVNAEAHERAMLRLARYRHALEQIVVSSSRTPRDGTQVDILGALARNALADVAAEHHASDLLGAASGNPHYRPSEHIYCRARERKLEGERDKAREAVNQLLEERHEDRSRIEVLDTALRECEQHHLTSEAADALIAERDEARALRAAAEAAESVEEARYRNALQCIAAITGAREAQHIGGTSQVSVAMRGIARRALNGGGT